MNRIAEILVAVLALLISTAICWAIGGIFGIPWIISVVAGIFAATCWLWDYLVLQPSELRALLLDIKEVSVAVLTLAGQAQQSGLEGLVKKLLVKLETLKGLGDAGDGTAKAILVQIPPFHERGMPAPYMRHWCVTAIGVLGGYLSSHPDRKKWWEDKFWLWVFLLLLLLDIVADVFRKER